MSAEPRPTILPPLKLLWATLLKSDLQIIKRLKMVVQVALPLLVPLNEESVDVCQLGVGILNRNTETVP
ncbi:unnamed protein product [Prunus armeniaca]